MKGWQEGGVAAGCGVAGASAGWWSPRSSDPRVASRAAHRPVASYLCEGHRDVGVM